MKRVVLLAVLLVGCGFTQPVPPGEGPTSDPSRERLAAQSNEAFFSRVAAKVDFASTHPSDLRANREAIEMTRRAVHHAKHSDGPRIPPIELLVQRAQGVVENLAKGDARCATNIEVAAMYVAAGMDEAAHDKYVGSMSECGSVNGLRVSATVFRRLGRCDQLQPHAVAIWPTAGSDEQIDVLDAVAICSTPVNLRPNLLAFAPPTVVGDYLALLDARARQRARDECRSSCWSAYESCQMSCWGGRCGCDETRALCEASCR